MTRSGAALGHGYGQGESAPLESSLVSSQGTTTLDFCAINEDSVASTESMDGHRQNVCWLRSFNEVAGDQEDAEELTPQVRDTSTVGM